MQFVVPKFIEREAKVVGPFSFRQFLYLAIAGGILTILWFALPLSLFIIAAVVLMGGALALAFLKPTGRPLPVLLKSIILFLTGTKIYLWKRRNLPPKIIKREVLPEAEYQGKDREKASSLVVARGSRLKRLATQIETRKK